jgi:hypothetical protein
MIRASLLIFLIITTLPVRAHAQYPNTPIMGWKMDGNNGHYTFTPAPLFGTANFHYDIYPPEKGNDDLDSWLSSKVEKDLQASGYTLQPGQSKARDIRAFKVYSVLVKDAAGKSWLLNYMAYLRQDHSIRFGRITEVPNAAIAKNNMNIAVRHFIRLSKQEGIPGETDGSSGSRNSGSTNSSTSTGGGNTSTGSGTTSPGRAETPVTTAGQGLKPAQIKGVVLHQEYGYGVGGMMLIKYNPYLLLQDGTIYSHPEVCAYDLDVFKSRETEPGKWGTWKLEDSKTLVVTMNSDHKPDRWQGTAHWFWAVPAAGNERLAGTWSTIGGGGNTAFGGGAIVVSSNVLTFNTQGQFTTLSTGGGSFNGSGGSVTAYSNKEGAGTYTFDGYSLELKYNNGKIVRKNFCFYADSKDVWVFGTRPYTPSDSNKKNK